MSLRLSSLLDVEELLLLIFSFLDIPSCIEVNQTCSRWHNFMDQQFWKIACRKNYKSDERLSFLTGSAVVNRYNRNKLKKFVSAGKSDVDWKREAFNAYARDAEKKAAPLKAGRKLFCSAISSQSVGAPSKARFCPHPWQQFEVQKSIDENLIEYQCNRCDTKCVLTADRFNGMWINGKRYVTKLIYKGST